jgi:hypothetical protein
MTTDGMDNSYKKRKGSRRSPEVDKKAFNRDILPELDCY